jgi:hypothetical protein
MSRILLITSTLPWPLRRNGGGQRTAILRRAMERWGDVDVLAIGGAQLLDESVTPALLEEHNVAKCIVRQKQERPAPWYAAGPLRGMHQLLESWRDRFRPDPEAQAWLAEQPKYDLIVGRYLAAALQGGIGTQAAGHTPCVLDFDDMEWQTLEAQLAYEPWPGLKGKIGSSMALREVRRLCYQSLKLFNHVWVTSDEDAMLLPHDAPPHSVLPNIPYEDDSLSTIEGDGDNNEVLFVGDLQLPPNREGLEQFLTRAWHKIRGAIPEATLRIVGRGLSEDQRARWSQIAGVDVIGFAPDLRACYERAGVCVVPIFYGGGTKIKVLEALLNERAVVTTGHAMRGYRSLNSGGTAVWVAPDIAAIAEGVIKLLNDPQRRREMAMRGKAAVATHFSPARFQRVVDASLVPMFPAAAIQGAA